MTEQPNYPVNNITNPSPGFSEALHKDYNHEMDWLWLAERLQCIEERIYCLERALYINPKSSRARQALERLEPIHRRRKQQPKKTEPHFWGILFGNAPSK